MSKTFVDGIQWRAVLVDFIRLIATVLSQSQRSASLNLKLGELFLQQRLQLYFFIAVINISQKISKTI